MAVPDGSALSKAAAPLIIFATFVGFRGRGRSGRRAMTVGVFLPAFCVPVDFYDRLEEAVGEQTAASRSWTASGRRSRPDRRKSTPSNLPRRSRLNACPHRWHVDLAAAGLAFLLCLVAVQAQRRRRDPRGGLAAGWCFRNQALNLIESAFVAPFPDPPC